MANVGRLVVFGCGGLIALIVLLGIVGALIGGGGEETSSNSPVEQKEEAKDEAQKEEPKEEEPTTYGLNETVTAGEATWTVTNAQRVNQLADPFGIDPPRQGTFVIVDFQFQNDGNEAKTLTQQALELEDASGRTSNPDPEDFRYIPQERNIFMQQVNPGVTQPGQVIFTVAPNASGLVLVVQDTNFFRAEQNQARVDLGL